MSAILSSTTGLQVPLTSPVRLLLADEDPAGGPHSTLFRRSQGPRADLYRLRPGVYTPRKEWDSLPHVKRHLVRILANAHAPRGRRTGVLARESAAVVLGIPMIGPLPSRLQFVLPGGSHGDTTPLAHVATAPEDTPIVMAHGLPVTDPAHTAVDLMRHRSFQSGLVALDHVLRERLATPEELLDIVEAQPGRQGNSRARFCLGHGDARSESVGESLSRALLIEQHLPAPICRSPITTAMGDSSPAWISPGRSCGASESSTARASTGARSAAWLPSGPCSTSVRGRTALRSSPVSK